MDISQVVDRDPAQYDEVMKAPKAPVAPKDDSPVRLGQLVHDEKLVLLQDQVRMGR